MTRTPSNQRHIAGINLSFLKYYSNIEVGTTLALLFTIVFSLSGFWVYVFLAAAALPYLEFFWVLIKSTKIDELELRKIRDKLDLPKRTFVRRGQHGENYAREVFGGRIIVLSQNVVDDLENHWHIIAHEAGHLTSLDRTLEIYLNLLYFLLNAICAMAATGLTADLFIVYLLGGKSFIFDQNEVRSYALVVPGIFIFGMSAFLIFLWRGTVILRRENVADLYAYSQLGESVVQWLRDQSLLERITKRKAKKSDFGPTHPSFTQRLHIVTKKIDGATRRLRVFSFFGCILIVIFHFMIFANLDNLETRNVQESTILGTYFIYFFLSGLFAPVTYIFHSNKLRFFVLENVALGCACAGVFISLIYVLSLIANNLGWLPFEWNTNSISAALSINISLLSCIAVGYTLTYFNIRRDTIRALIIIFGLILVVPIATLIHYFSDHFRMFFGVQGGLLVLLYGLFLVFCFHYMQNRHSDIYAPTLADDDCES